MNYTFDGRDITNTKTKEHYDCRDTHDLDELTNHLNSLSMIIRIYNDAIQVNKDSYHKGSMEPMLLPTTRTEYKIKHEALQELLDKIELIKKSEGIL